MDLTDYLSEEFSTGELVKVAEAIGLAPTSRWGKRRLLDAIRARIANVGVPVPDDNELLEEFLYVAEYIDSEGNIEDKKDKLDLDKFMEENDIDEVSECFGFADDKDPACRRCKLYVYCAEERIQNLPACYGRLYNPSKEECKNCLEAYYCSGGN